MVSTCNFQQRCCCRCCRCRCCCSLSFSIYRSPKVHQVGRPELAVIARGRRWEHRRSNRGTCPRCGAPGNRSNSTNDRGRIPTSLSHAGKKLYWFVYCTFCIYHICIFIISNIMHHVRDVHVYYNWLLYRNTWFVFNSTFGTFSFWVIHCLREWHHMTSQL